MPDTPRDIQRYLDRPLDDLMQEFDLYTEQTGVVKGTGSAWDKIVPAEAKDLRRRRLV